MSLAGNRSRLAALTRELVLHWQDTGTYWRDAKYTEFDRRFMMELQAHVDRSVTIIEKLDDLLRKVRHDCE
jgi:hypothetical protein